MKKSEDFENKLEELKTKLIEAVNEEVERIRVIAEISDMEDEPIELKRPIIYVDNLDRENQVIDKVGFDSTVEVSYLSDYLTTVRFEDLETQFLVAILEQIEEMET